nr:NADH dehydrogenase subunit 4L [Pteroptyx maipo]
MLIYSFSIFIFMYLVGLSVLCFKCKHLLMLLLSLEFIVLSLFLGLVVFMMKFYYEYYFLKIFLSLSVCDGSLGLSFLVSMVRSYGNDYFHMFNFLW